MTNTTKLTAKGLYSTDMRGKPMTANSYYKQISIINNQPTELFNLASLGFYKTGQLLNRAKKELKGDFGKLKKDLAEDGLHIKQQERYMAIARNKNIEIKELIIDFQNLKIGFQKNKLTQSLMIFIKVKINLLEKF